MFDILSGPMSCAFLSGLMYITKCLFIIYGCIYKLAKILSLSPHNGLSFLPQWMYIVPVVVIMVLSGGGQEGGR